MDNGTQKIFQMQTYADLHHVAQASMKFWNNLDNVQNFSYRDVSIWGITHIGVHKVHKLVSWVRGVYAPRHIDFKSFVFSLVRESERAFHT